ncbi:MULTISPECIES: TlpA disulfide reductase family protein [unclassified Micromonospora]|uniref:TlpA family protein disulfide reductase n=1 Tax=unclassified Micromonospora TaxID=2617518 RepID=UPI00098D1B42|nr:MULTISPECIES: TlpA disulfide reductase family protein [unclassified Micromonospora]MDI5937348.1 TlpA disulfide reductase family protein [Micromonospora sp. DH15]OON30055.1 alkyl hydroperoxide reductase [Micromonospora sp. Rc5]
MTHRSTARRSLVALLLPFALLAAACTATPAEEKTAEPRRNTRPSPFAACATLTVPPPSAAPTPAGSGGPELPELTLPCFTGGDLVALRDVRGPAVVNLWASWCPPCRKELPAFQRLSERADGRLQVIGVNTRDSRDAAQSIGEDFGVRFPVLFDQGESLRRALNRNAVPLTVLVGADGRIRHVDTSGALDDARLAALVREHLGVVVPA